MPLFRCAVPLIDDPYSTLKLIVKEIEDLDCFGRDGAMWMEAFRGRRGLGGL